MTDLEKARSRWRRWFGQKGVELLDTNYQCWANNVLKAHKLAVDDKSGHTNCGKVLLAINNATIDELQKLDCIVLDEKLEAKR